MALAVQTQVSDGSLTKIQVGIDFIEQADIQVYFDLAASPLVAGSDYTWTASKTITFSSAVPAGTTAFLLRQTNVEEVLNVFDGGASFSRYTLDENFHQILLLAQEVREGVGLRGIFLPLDMHGYKIKNLGDPTVDTDAANLAAVKALCAKVTSGYQAADANLQAQLTGNVPLLASAFSPISWHGQTIENSVSIPANKNAWSFGPQMRIAEGQRVQIGEGSTWTIAEGDEQEGSIDLSQYVKNSVYGPDKTATDSAIGALDTRVTAEEGKVQPISKGGTGATTAAAARTALGAAGTASPTFTGTVTASNLALGNALPVSGGGTGVTTLPALVAALTGAGGIVEQGSNSNGFWVKLSTGALVQWQAPTTTPSVPANNTSTGTNVTFPVAFLNTAYYLDGSAYPNASFDHYGVCSALPQSTTQGLVYIRNGAAAQTFQLSWFAIGRWA